MDRPGSAAGHPARSEQIYSGVAFKGDLYIGTWPEAEVFRLDGDNAWQCVGRVGAEREVMGMINYNGKVYLGSLPMANVWRMDDDDFAFLGTIDHASAAMRRAWSFAVYQGRLFAGTLPSGNVCSLEAGKMATWDVVFPAGRRHVAAVKSGGTLRLYVDGRLVSTSSAFSPADFDVNTEAPLSIGFGALRTLHRTDERRAALPAWTVCGGNPDPGYLLTISRWKHWLEWVVSAIPTG